MFENELEEKAYRIGLIWIFLYKKNFPDDRTYIKYPKNKDPRTSYLFKHCYKLIKETQNIFKFEQYKFYIQAQFDILKANNANIDPICLNGDKAWIRWKVWNKKFKNIQITEIPYTNILNLINNDYKFLKNKEKTQENIKKWVETGKLSPFYPILSPLGFKMDLENYEKMVNNEIKEEFKKVFHEEFT